MKYITLFFSLISFAAFSQSDISKIQANIKKERMSEYQNFKNESKENYRLAIETAILKGLDTTNIEGIDSYGNIQYLQNYNSDAAEATNTDDLHSGGSLGLNLEGNGFTIGIWEANDDGSHLPRTTHENLNTVTTGLHGDTGVANSKHATHVAGTLVGNGSGNINAKGMAPQANLNAFDTSNNGNEMDLQASAGMLISNHSYGSISGWNSNSGTWQWTGGASTFIGGGEDVEFGLYNVTARLWDIHCFIHPNSAVFKSAGNDRNDNPVPGTNILDPSGNTVVYNTSIHPLGDGIFDTNGYNSIPTYGVSKNIITVGAINGDNNTMSTFSGWGPTDDGRIKPDVVGDGVVLFSSEESSDTDYGNSSGTSMSSPNVAGTALLLQEHFEDLNGTGNYMLSATLKALLIHSATDLGNLGPDYQFGWGLINANEAVQILDEADDPNVGTFIIEETHDGITKQFGFISSCAYAGSVNATMVYTDEWGAAQSTETNTPNLVNDLDFKFEHGTLPDERPYVMSPANPNALATNGDNDLDNVERIDFTFPVGVEVLTVEVEGSLLNGTQDYSLIVSGSGIDKICEVVADQANININSGNYCNDSEMTTEAIINNKITAHTSTERIILKPGLTVNNGSSARFYINECIYVN